MVDCPGALWPPAAALRLPVIAAFAGVTVAVLVFVFMVGVLLVFGWGY
jgi:hypothetical protein